MNIPFIPAAACPGTVHRNGYLPVFKVTMSFAVFPGPISGHFYSPAVGETTVSPSGTSEPDSEHDDADESIPDKIVTLSLKPAKDRL